MMPERPNPYWGLLILCLAVFAILAVVAVPLLCPLLACPIHETITDDEVIHAKVA